MKKEPRHARLSTLGSAEVYAGFDGLDGTHPLQDAVPDSVVLYQVRKLNTGKVLYFNYDLAREMGLISYDHPNVMNATLEKKILETFCIQIINEYDIKTKKQFDPKTIKPNKYMATRYLQLQHSDKSGRTSGDGRSIWNGQHYHKGKIWDVSSRGTGVTCLAPGAVEAGQPLKTGGTQFGYGCGMADIDELIGTAIMAEIFHRQNIGTERVLTVIDIGNGLGIGVRAHPNLIRPAHMFMYLKQGDLKNLKKITDYFISRQEQNKSWTFSQSRLRRYDELLEYISNSFARLTARLDVDYIFVWLDWDGDNILADASIIDYGSIRQFGLRHDEYRYDDVDRFSTNLNEQRKKARETVMSYCQLVDFLKTGRKKPVSEFKGHPAVLNFDKSFEDHRLRHFLFKMGFNHIDQAKIIRSGRKLLGDFEKEFRFFENIKTLRKPEKVPDGINIPAIFNMREALRTLPRLLFESNSRALPNEILFQTILATSARGYDRKYKNEYEAHFTSLQKSYLNLVEFAKGRRTTQRILRDIAARSSIINRPDRITGNAITIGIEDLCSRLKKGMSSQELQTVMDKFILSQNMNPSQTTAEPNQLLRGQRTKTREALMALFKVVHGCREDI